ncbi:MAG: S46 family peptidase [Rhabdochlamydiaceae bacterium]|nr:S46 family peptidase [Candidatus Amphrikana amoebophyrae]
MAKIITTISALLISTSLLSDEGMWTFDNLPKDQIAQKYGVNLTQESIDHMRLSSLRISIGGSGSFVSPNGLILTNHHVASRAIENLSSEDQNYIKDGFYAQTQDLELGCPNLFVDQLIAIDDITYEVNQKLNDSMSSLQKDEVRKEILNQLKEEKQAQSGLHVEVVTLYKGGKYQLYSFKRYTDIRLVMAPDKTLASFGGDEMNFEFPRMNFDFAFLRAYENGEPVSNSNYLKWNSEGPKEGEVLFVTGNPGSTNRLYTADHRAILFQYSLPRILKFLEERLAVLNEYSEISEEHKRRAQGAIGSLMNAQKVYQGEYRDFQEKPLVQNKYDEESALFKTLSSEQKEPWLTLGNTLETQQDLVTQASYFERYAFFCSKTYAYARHLNRYAVERNKPNGKRFKEYVDSEYETLKRMLLSQEPIYSDLEVAMIEAGLVALENELGSDHPLIVLLAKGPTPFEIIRDTQINSLEFRKELLENPDLIKTSNDPLIVFTREIDVYGRQKRVEFEEQYEAVLNDCYDKIAQVMFATHGESIYPDATFTLRLSYGNMKGYMGSEGYIAPVSNLGELYAIYDQNGGAYPYNLNEKWQTKSYSFDPNISVNFVSTNDIIGGNSGSPVINDRGEVVGLIFDGNKDAHLWNLEFDDTTARSISVHTEAIEYCIDKMYGAKPLVQELQR